MFIILDYSAPLPGNKNLFSTSPWYNALWPMMYDPNDEHPILTFDNFNNTNASINAFSLYYKGVTDKFIVFDFGTAGYVEINSSVYESGDWFFFGVISDVPFTQVQLHTNQNGSSIKLDSMVYSADATIPEGENPIPEPTTILLLGVGLVGLAGVTRRKLKK